MTLENSNRRRAGNKAYVTKLIAEIGTKIESGSFEQEELTAWLEELQSKRNEINTLNREIQSTIENQTLMDADIENSSKYSLKISIALSKIKAAIRSEPTQNDHAKVVKLPVIKLNKFTGDPLEWSRFWDIFESSIHKLHDLSKAAKFQYLIGQLEDNAANLSN